MTARRFAKPGRTLWDSVTDQFELDPAELALLGQACLTLDELIRLEKAMKTADLLVEGSKGQPVSNPLLTQVREHRRLLDALCRSLALPVDGAQVGARRDGQRSKAAVARHQRAKLRAMRGGVDVEA